MKFTHYGWFGFCPVKLADLDSEGPMVAPRWAILEPLLWLAEVVQEVSMAVCSALFPDYEPLWKIKVTGEFPDGGVDG